MPTVADSQDGKTVPVAFMSRKLTTSQSRTWDKREKEAYAVVSALEKWATWIGQQPVLILTDHKTLKSWTHEILQISMGPSGRRARWHQKLSQFRPSVQYVPGKENVVADAMSRWAYPASQAGGDVSRHGNLQDVGEMKQILEEDKLEGREGAIGELALLKGENDF